MDCLHGAVWFSTLDLKSGYCQVELEEEAKPLTAFTVGPLGFWECECMPFGLTNAPATFQRLMESCFGELHLNWFIIYLDDIIVFSRTPEEHIHRLRAVFEKLKAAGLKLKPSKCDFFKKEINYLGHVVSEKGVSTDPKKIKAVTKWPQPTTVTEVRSFLEHSALSINPVRGIKMLMPYPALGGLRQWNWIHRLYMLSVKGPKPPMVK